MDNLQRPLPALRTQWKQSLGTVRKWLAKSSFPFTWSWSLHFLPLPSSKHKERKMQGHFCSQLEHWIEQSEGLCPWTVFFLEDVRYLEDTFFMEMFLIQSRALWQRFPQSYGRWALCHLSQTVTSRRGWGGGLPTSWSRVVHFTQDFKYSRKKKKPPRVIFF